MKPPRITDIRATSVSVPLLAPLGKSADAARRELAIEQQQRATLAAARVPAALGPQPAPPGGARRLDGERWLG